MRTPALLLTLAATPLLSQTSKTPVHRSTAAHPATAVHRPACGFPLPEISTKIPALPTTVQKCPTAEYSLTYIDTKIGQGEPAVARRWYTVRYTGYLPDGTKFDSSYDHPGGAPISFPYGAHQVIAGWDTGFEGMRVGGKRRLFVPYQLAYGELGRPPIIPPKTMLIFDVELVSESETRPEAPRPPVAPGSAAPTAAPTGSAPGRTAPAAPGQTAAPATPPAATAAPAPTPTPSPAGTAAPPPVTSTTPASSTQPTEPSTTTEPKK